MKESDILIIEANKQLLDKVVECHFNCFNSQTNFSMILGQEFVRMTYKFFLDDKISFGFVAFYNDEIVGFIFCRSDYFVDALNHYKPRKISFLKSLIKNPLLLFNRQLLFKCIQLAFLPKTKVNLNKAPSHIDGKVATLSSIAVLNMPKSSIISKKLTEVAEQKIKEEGKLIFRAGTRFSNKKAIAFFKKRGFSIDPIISNKNTVFLYKKLF